MWINMFIMHIMINPSDEVRLANVSVETVVLIW